MLKSLGKISAYVVMPETQYADFFVSVAFCFIYCFLLIHIIIKLYGYKGKPTKQNYSYLVSIPMSSILFLPSITVTFWLYMYKYMYVCTTIFR